MAGDQTEARRERMRTLWIHSDKEIAETLIEEGYGGSTPRTKAGKAKQLASMQRNVWNDRQCWKKKWRAQKQATTEDASETRGEYLATLDSYREVGVEILTDDKVKGTPRVQALMALTRIEEAKAKAVGVAETAPVDPAGDPNAKRVPFLGLVLGLDRVTPEAKKKIDEWNSGGSEG